MSETFNFYKFIPDEGLEERRLELEEGLDILCRQLIASRTIHTAIMLEQRRRRGEL